MKLLNIIYLSLLMSSILVPTAEAAKENFDRSKPHANKASGLDDDCNGGGSGSSMSCQKPTSKAGLSKISDHNSTRPKLKSDDNDLFIRKRPGRTKNEAGNTCETSKKSPVSNTNKNCPKSSKTSR